MIYLDNAATTPINEEVKFAINDGMDMYYNPSSTYSYGYLTKNFIETARMQIADTINANPEEIYFTSGASEGNNWIIKGGNWKVYTSTIEHHSVLNAAKHNVYGCDKIPVDINGNVNEFSLNYILQEALPGDLVSIMYVNNEIGSIQDIKKLASIVHEYGLFFHTDATQAYGHMKIDVKDLEVDALTISGHKIGAPKGIGFAYIRNGFEVRNLIDGGQQERHKRAGTENVPYILGLAKACEISDNYTNADFELYNHLRAALKKQLDYPFISYNGGGIPYIVSMTINNVAAEELVEYLQQNDILVSSGSACNSENNEPSHVLKAIGMTDEQANSTIRISFGTQNTIEDINKFTNIVNDYLNIRGML